MVSQYISRNWRVGKVSLLHVCVASYILGTLAQGADLMWLFCCYASFLYLSLYLDPFPPPESITLSNIVHRPSLLLTFTWGPDPGCRALYTITSTCGNCATSIRSTETICHNVEVPMTAGGRVCTFEVRTDACGSIPGVMTNTLRVNLRCMSLHDY